MLSLSILFFSSPTVGPKWLSRLQLEVMMLEHGGSLVFGSWRPTVPVFFVFLSGQCVALAKGFSKRFGVSFYNLMCCLV